MAKSTALTRRLTPETKLVSLPETVVCAISNRILDKVDVVGRVQIGQVASAVTSRFPDGFAETSGRDGNDAESTRNRTRRDLSDLSERENIGEVVRAGRRVGKRARWLVSWAPKLKLKDGLN